MKPTQLPRFIELVDYRQLHPTREGNRLWRFVTTRVNALIIPLNELPHTIQSAEFFDASGKLWLAIEKGINVAIFTIEKGYAWNGATPKRWRWPFGWIGTPDFECTRLATLWHDIFCQFQQCEHLPFTRDQIDMLFKTMIEMTDHDLIAETYYAGVRAGGKFFPRSTHGEYSKPL
jgi:hypothetical protein